MLLTDILISVIYLVLISVFVGVGYSVLPKDFKKLLKKILKIAYQKVFNENQKSKKKKE